MRVFIIFILLFIPQYVIGMDIGCENGDSGYYDEIFLNEDGDPRCSVENRLQLSLIRNNIILIFPDKPFEINRFDDCRTAQAIFELIEQELVSMICPYDSNQHVRIQGFADSVTTTLFLDRRRSDIEFKVQAIMQRKLDVSTP